MRTLSKRVVIALMASVALMGVANSASAATLLTDYIGTMTIDPNTNTGSLSSSVTLIYQNAPKTTKTPAVDSLFYSFQNADSTSHSGSAAVAPPGTSDLTTVDYTFNVATPVDLVYGQVLNTIGGNLKPLSGGTIQLFDETTSTALTSAYVIHPSGGSQYSATTGTLNNIILTNTLDLYELVVKGNVPSSTLKTGGPLVEYSPSVFATAVVPEPASWAMMLVGFGGLGMAMRAQRKKPALSVA